MKTEPLKDEGDSTTNAQGWSPFLNITLIFLLEFLASLLVQNSIQLITYILEIGFS